jgi:hypothetical protein
LLEMPTQQAMVELRLFQKNLRIYEPQFVRRGISRSYYVDRAFAYRRNTQFFENALREYDTLRASFPSIRTENMNYFCFKTGFKKDPRAEIEDWLDSIRRLPPVYKRLVSQEYIELAARTNRGDQLRSVLTERIKIIDSIMRENEQAPHPAIGREIVEYAVFKLPNPRKFLKDEYIPRWNYIEKHESMEGIQLPVLRRLVLFDTRKPGSMIRMYKSLCRKYEGDPYITPAMVDEAVRNNPGSAVSFLSRTQKQKRKEQEIALALPEKRKVYVDLSQDNTAMSPEDIVVGKVREETREQKMIAALLQPASAIEKATVAAAYSMSWLAPDDMRDAVHDDVDVRPLFAHHGVRALSDLKPIAEAILKRLVSAK